VLVRDRARELDLVHQWLDTWSGLGLVVAGMTAVWGGGGLLILEARTMLAVLPSHYQEVSV
jgi:hypothetical protein